MKKIVIISTLIAALLTTASADFSFGDLFKEANDSVPSVKTVTEVSSDANDSAVKISKDVKDTAKDMADSAKDIATKATDDVNVTTTVKEVK